MTRGRVHWVAVQVLQAVVDAHVQAPNALLDRVARLRVHEANRSDNVRGVEAELLERVIEDARRASRQAIRNAEQTIALERVLADATREAHAIRAALALQQATE